MTVCNAYQEAKFHHLTFTSSNKISSIPFELLLVDVWGPYYVVSMSGARYFLTIVDDCIRSIGLIYFIISSNHVQFWINSLVVSNHFKVVLKFVQTDSGGECMSNAYKSLFQSLGKIRQCTIPYTLQKMS